MRSLPLSPNRAVPQLRGRQIRPASRYPIRQPVAAAHYREETRSWEIVLDGGGCYSTQFLITAIGILSAPTMPNIPGISSFEGLSCHTHSWPKEGVDFAGKRVGIIGTGATAVQTIQEIAKTVGHLTVFQRTPNWCAPLHNDFPAVSRSRLGLGEARGCQCRARHAQPGTQDELISRKRSEETSMPSVPASGTCSKRSFGTAGNPLRQAPVSTISASASAAAACAGSLLSRISVRTSAVMNSMIAVACEAASVPRNSAFIGGSCSSGDRFVSNLPGHARTQQHTGRSANSTCHKGAFLRNYFIRLERDRWFADLPLEGDGFELVWGFSCQVVVLVFAGSLFGAGKAVLRPVACDQVRGARGRGQGTETVAKLGGLPPSGACVSQRLDG